MLFLRNNQKGSSLLEVLAVLSVVSVLGISALKLISNIHGKFKQSMATMEIKELQKVISENYCFLGDYSAFFEGDEFSPYQKLCETDKTAPSQMCYKNGSNYKLKHRLSGNAVVQPASNHDKKMYKIIFDGLSRSACVALAQIDWLDRKKVNIFQLNINSENADGAIAYFPKKNGKGFPVTTKDVMAKCNKNDNKNAIIWFFY